MTESSAVSLPSEFGGSVEAFREEWCGGSDPSQTTEEIAVSLRTLCRLWPKYVEHLVGLSARGSIYAAFAVDLGTLLQTCEPVARFRAVHRRLTEHSELGRHLKIDRAAYSELVVVAALKRCGYEVEHEPPLAGKVLDAVCFVDSQPIYVEVVAPDESEAFRADQTAVSALSQVLSARAKACRIEVELRESVDAASTAMLIHEADHAPPGEWIEVGSVARIRRIPSGHILPPVFDGDGAQIVIAGVRNVQDDSSGVIVRWDASDVRAKRVFNTEYHQFSAAVPNVLVVNVSAVPDALEAWPAEMARLLQPTRNRKVGAVVVFTQGLVGPPECVRRRWVLVVNPHAHLHVPEKLLESFEALDESQHLGLLHPKRVVPA